MFSFEGFLPIVMTICNHLCHNWRERFCGKENLRKAALVAFINLQYFLQQFNTLERRFPRREWQLWESCGRLRSLAFNRNFVKYINPVLPFMNARKYTILRWEIEFTMSHFPVFEFICFGLCLWLCSLAFDCCQLFKRITRYLHNCPRTVEKWKGRSSVVPAVSNF